MQPKFIVPPEIMRMMDSARKKIPDSIPAYMPSSGSMPATGSGAYGGSTLTYYGPPSTTAFPSATIPTTLYPSTYPTPSPAPVPAAPIKLSLELEALETQKRIAEALEKIVERFC
jgi:hypothetical protein